MHLKVIEPSIDDSILNQFTKITFEIIQLPIIYSL